jgi:hypothetical protein
MLDCFALHEETTMTLHQERNVWRYQKGWHMLFVYSVGEAWIN